MEQTLLPVAKCYESETNPRGTKFEDDSFKELVASIAEKGVLVPVLARPRKNGAKEYEVVAGSRRLRASIQAGLKEIPAMVRELSEVEAQEAQIVENLQRADIHPLEEGLAYRNLIETSDPRYELEDVTVKVGKSVTFVRDRLVLTNLIPKAQKQFRNGEITAGHAALIARLTTAKQKEAIKWLEPDWNGQPVPSTRELREWIQEQTYLDLSNAPWKDDATLKATYEGCDECKGQGGDLFGKDASEACTNPKCFAQRAVAYIQIKRNENPNLLLLSGDYGTTEPYGVAKETVHSKSNYEEVGKKKCAEATQGIIVEGTGIGHIKTACVSTDCKTHKSTYRPSYEQKPEEKKKAREQRKKERLAAEKKAERESKQLDAVLSRLKTPLSSKHLAVLFDLTIDASGSSATQPVCKRRKLEYVTTEHAGWNGKTVKSRDYEATLRKAGTSDTEKLRIIVEVLSQRAYSKKFLKQL